MNKKIKNALICEYDGVQFKSKLELFCYKQLKLNNIPFVYQPEKTVLLKSFKTNFKCYESFGRIYRDKSKSIINDTRRFDLTDSNREISYTPDFIGVDDNWIVETKGFANDSFPLRWKLFKSVLMEVGFNGILMKPESQKEILKCIEIIKEHYSVDKENPGCYIKLLNKDKDETK